MSLLFLPMVLLAMLTAYVAETKGRGGFVWFLAGLMTGPIALVAVWLLPPVQHKIYFEGVLTIDTGDEDLKR